MSEPYPLHVWRGIKFYSPIFLALFSTFQSYLRKLRTFQAIIYGLDSGFRPLLTNQNKIYSILGFHHLFVGILNMRLFGPKITTFDYKLPKNSIIHLVVRGIQGCLFSNSRERFRFKSYTQPIGLMVIKISF